MNSIQSAYTAITNLFYGDINNLLETENKEQKIPTNSNDPTFTTTQGLVTDSQETENDESKPTEKNLSKFLEACKRGDSLDRFLNDPVTMFEFIKHQDENGNSGMHLAAKKGFLTVIKEIDSYSLNPNAGRSFRNQQGAYPVHLAAENGHIKIVEYFEKDPYFTINCEDNKGETPLDYATREEKIEMVKFLLNSTRTNPSRIDNNYEYPIHRAARQNRISIARLLISKEPHLLYAKNKNGETPLDIAIKCYPEDIEFMQKIFNPLEGTFHVNLEKYSPLHIAILNYDVHAEKGIDQYLKELIESTLSSEEKQKEINDALYLAIRKDLLHPFDDKSVFPSLFENGAILHYEIIQEAKKTKDRVFIMHYLSEACKYGRPEHLKPFFTDSDYPVVELTDKDGNTVLHFAAINKRADIIEFLLDRGGNIIINDKNIKGHSPEDCAIMAGRNENAKLLKT